MLRRTRISPLRPVREPDAERAVEQRTLSDYDIALDIDLGADNEGAQRSARELCARGSAPTVGDQAVGASLPFASLHLRSPLFSLLN